MSDAVMPWRGDPAEIVAEFDADAHSRAFVAMVALMIPSWHRDALCREYSQDLWFPKRGESLAPAREVCARCPVTEECLAEALADPDLDVGVRAGIGGRARAAMRRQLRGAA